MVAAVVKSQTPSDTSPLAQFSFPRTGKRGVPQQFPRRLYEMLDSETKTCHVANDCPQIISWSVSGKAFRIHDVTEFAEIVLPKYFRTKKFSSFQRNLNLYGFAKVRRGADMDMYAHPSFVRDRPDALLQLHKNSTKSPRYRCVSDASSETSAPRPVSPPTSMSSPVASSTQRVQTVWPGAAASSPPTQIVIHGFHDGWMQASVSPHSSPRSSSDSTIVRPNMTSSPNCRTVNDRGKLDLLAMALEREFFAK